MANGVASKANKKVNQNKQQEEELRRQQEEARKRQEQAARQQEEERKRQAEASKRESEKRNQSNSAATPNAAIPVLEEKYASDEAIQRGRDFGRKAREDVDSGRVKSSDPFADNPYGRGFAGMAEVYKAQAAAEEAQNAYRDRLLAENASRNAQRHGQLSAQSTTMPMEQNMSGQMPTQDVQAIANGPVDVLGTRRDRSMLSESGQKEVDRLSRKIESLQRTPITGDAAIDEATQTNNQSQIADLQRQIDSIYKTDNSERDANIDRYLDPQRRLSKYEKENANAIFEEYINSNPKAKELYNTNDAAMSSLLAQRFTPEEAEEYARMITLKNKISRGQSAGLHAAESMPFVKGLADKSTEKYGERVGKDLSDYNYSSQLEQTMTQNPLASTGGNMAYQLGSYAAFSPLVEGIPVVGKAAEAAGKLFKNSAVGSAVSNIIRGQAADTILDTLPNEIIPDIMEGNWKDIPKDIGLSQLTNLGFNVLGEAGGALARNFIPSLRNADEVADAVKQELNPADLAKQNEADMPRINAEREQAVEALEDLQKQIPEAPEEKLTPEGPKDYETARLLRQIEIAQKGADYSDSFDARQGYEREVIRLTQELKQKAPELFDENGRLKNISDELIRKAEDSIPQEIKDYVQKRNDLINRTQAIFAEPMSPEEMAQTFRSINAMDEYMNQKYPDLFEDGNFVGFNEASRRLSKQTNEINDLAEQIPDNTRLTDEEVAELKRRQTYDEWQEEVDPNNVVYHSGTLSRLNKAETRGKMHEGSRNTGYYGTGHYFVDSAHKSEIDGSSNYSKKPYSSVDISKYNNLYRVASDKQASDLHSFSEKFMRYINGYNDKYFKGADDVIDEAAKTEYLDDLYENFERLFPDSGIDKNTFINMADTFRNEEARGIDLYDREDSAFTKLMKEMGYNGVDSRGTRSADTSRGVVIYDLDEDSILQSNVIDDEIKKGLMNRRVRNEGQSLFNEATDAEIQKSIDSQTRRAQISEEVRKIHDDTPLREAQDSRRKIQDRISQLEDAQSRYYALLNDEEYLNREAQRTVREMAEFDLDISLDEAKTSLLEGTQRDYDEITSTIDDLYAQLDETEKFIADEQRQIGDVYRQVEAKYKETPNNSTPAVKETVEQGARQADEIPAVAAGNITSSDVIPPSGGDVIPKVDAAAPAGDKISQYATNTMRRGTNLTPEEYAQQDLSQFMYESKTEKQSMEDAFRMIEEEGADNLKERLMSDDAKDFTQSEVDALLSLIRTNNATIRALKFDGKLDEAAALRAETTAMNKKVRQQSTSNAQALQALAKWTRNTPEGMLMQAENIVNGNAKTNKSPLQEALDKLKRSKKDVEFSPEFEDEFLSAAEKLQEIGDMDSREAKDIMAKLGRLVNDQIPVKLNEKVQAYLMDNMLGNFRTLITRNAGGNLGLNAMEQTLTRPLAAGIDRLVAKKTGVRAQAGMSIPALKEYIQGFAKGISDEAHDLKTGLHTARTGENTLEEAIRANRHVFKNKVMDKLDSLVKNGLSVGDRPFYEATYKQTLGDYNRLRKAGAMGADIQNLSDEMFDEYAKTAANLNALAAVYQNNSELSQALLKMKDGIGDLSEGMLGFDILSQFSMPFVKTPANVVDRAIDYSPLGIIRNAVRTTKEGGIGGENFDQNRFVNETARNILGTTLMGAGAGAAANGIMSGAYSDDADEKRIQKESGMQEYALNLPGNMQMDISWIPVLGSNLVAADAAYNAYKNAGGDNTGLALTKGIAEGGQALFDQSFFQGLQRLFGTGETYNSDDNIVTNMLNVVKQGFGQAIPSLVRQAAQVTDTYQRDLGGSNKDTSFGLFDNYTLNSWANNIPWLREAVLNPKVDSQGNLIKESQGRNLGSRILEDMILPGKITQLTNNALNDEANRLSGITGNKTSYLPKANRNKVDTEDHTLTNQEYLEYQQRHNGELNRAGEALMNSEMYNMADDQTKESMLSNVYSAVSTAINSEYNGKELTGAAKAYAEGGMDAVIDYVQYGGILKQYDLENNEKNREMVKKGGIEAVQQASQAKEFMDEAGVTSNSKVGEMIQNDVASGNIEHAQSVVDSKTTLQSLGLDKSGPTFTYEKAQTVFPNLSVEEFAQTYKAIDADGNQGIKQGEIIDYLNSGSYTQAQGNKIWSGYGNSTWKKIPVLDNNGTWSLKSK